MFPHFLCGPVFHHIIVMCMLNCHVHVKLLQFIVMCMLKQLLIKKDKNKTTYYIRYLFTPRVITELTAKLSHLIILVCCQIKYRYWPTVCYGMHFFHGTVGTIMVLLNFCALW